MRGDRDDAPVIAYGKDGPAFVRLCPHCARFLRFPKEMTWHENGLGECRFPKIECSKCGLVEPDHIGWAGDFQP